VLALLSPGTVVEVVVFAGATLLFLFLLRSVFARRMAGPGVPSRTEVLPGSLAEVTEPIDPVRGTGRVLVEGHGRFQKRADAGLNIIVPFLDSVRAKIDLRER